MARWDELTIERTFMANPVFLSKLLRPSVSSFAKPLPSEVRWVD